MAPYQVSRLTLVRHADLMVVSLVDGTERTPLSQRAPVPALV